MTQKIPIEQLASPASSSFAQHRHKFHPRLNSGFFQRIRNTTMYTLLILFFIAPWLSWNNRPAMLIDLANHHYYLFGLTFLPQDIFYLAGLLLVSAFALFALTVFAGRVFCGYSCPQTIWVNLFIRIERLFEGERHQRIRLDKAPMRIKKLAKRIGKHSIWLLISLATGLTFVSYFVPVSTLYTATLPVTLLGYQLLLPSASGFTAFFIFLFSFMTYLNAGFIREQVCFHICPYGRFQSVMFDRDTLIVSYDDERGEPRGTHKKNTKTQLGDCIDCFMCVQVCPTGIDIRNGLQMECIQCAACIDACNDVMDQIGKPHGLVKYTTEREVHQHEKTHWISPKLAGYAVILAMVCAAFTYSLMSRSPLELDVFKDRNQMYRINPDNLTENSFLLKAVNKTEQTHTYTVNLITKAQLNLEKKRYQLLLDPSESSTIPITVLGDQNQTPEGQTPILFELIALDNPQNRVHTATYFDGPSRKELAQQQHDAQRMP